MAEIYMVTSMFASREQALPVARQLVQEKRAACVNIHTGVTSVYRWENTLCEEPEVMLSAKTTKEHCQAAIDTIKRLHPYEVPCILASPVDTVSSSFMKWVKQETAG